MKGRNAKKLDGITAEFFKKGGEALVEWLRSFDACINGASVKKFE